MPIKTASSSFSHFVCCWIQITSLQDRNSKLKGEKSPLACPCTALSPFSTWHITTMAWAVLCYHTCKLFRGMFAYLEILCISSNSFHFTLSHPATSNIRARYGASRIWECLEGWITPLLWSGSSAVPEGEAGLQHGKNGIIPREGNAGCGNTSHWRKKCLWLVPVIYFGNWCKFIHSYRVGTSTKGNRSAGCHTSSPMAPSGSKVPHQHLSCCSAESRRIHMACSWCVPHGRGTQCWWILCCIYLRQMLAERVLINM